MRLTIRTRLTLVYGGLFLAAGIVLLGATYALVSQQLPQGARGFVGGQPPTGTATPLATATNQGTAQSGITSAGRVGAGGTPDAGSQALVTQITKDTRDSALTALLTQGGIALAGVGVLATVLGWVIAGRLVQPLDRMTETARRIAEAPAARGLHERIAMDGPRDEIKRLADTFDLMLERLDHAFDGQRRFIANASHELRTPLTLNRALLEVAMRRRDSSEEVRQLGATLLGINGRHEQLIDGLLLLARSDREVTDRSYVDLADIVEHVSVQLPAEGVTVYAEPGEAPTTGNPVLLERLVQNLVENGIRYNVPEGGWVRVASRTRTDGRVELTVANTGPPVPRYEIPSLFEPFHRAADDRLARAPGAGLGLSIVEAVARAHGGDVHAEPRESGGLVVTVTLPGAD